MFEESSAKDLRDRMMLRQKYERTYGTDTGKELLSHLLVRSHFFSTTYTRNADTYFREGERNLILELLDIIPGLVGDAFKDWCTKKENGIRKMFEEYSAMIGGDDEQE